LGDRHPDTLVALNDLSMSQAALGNLEESIRLMKSVVESRAQTLGPHHPHTVHARHNLLQILLTAEDIEAALSMKTKIEESVSFMQVAALALVGEGKILEACARLVELEDLCIRVLGKSHGKTQEVLGAQVGVLSALGDQAVPHYNQLVEGHKKRY